MTFNQEEFQAKLQELILNKPDPSYPPQYQGGNFERKQFGFNDLPLDWFETITSTNQKAWELLAQGFPAPRIVIAAQQTAGRGQWGRQWQSELGGLYLSVLLKCDIPAENAPHLTLASAWGIAQALRSYQIPVLLKWLNDLILDKRKLGGIKTETHIQQGKISHAVIGVGINWTNPVPEKGINLYQVMSKQVIGGDRRGDGETGRRGDENYLFDSNSVLQSFKPNQINSLETLAAVTIYGILSAYQFYLSEGIDRLLPFYLELLDSIGRTINIDGCQGVVSGVTPDGNLRVRLQSVGAAAEIVVPPGKVSLGYDN